MFFILPLLHTVINTASLLACYIYGLIFLSWHSGHNSWVTGTLGYKSGTKHNRNIVKVLL